MTTTPETVEQLAEQIVAEVFKRSASRYSDWTTADIVENIQYKLATFLRSHGIDPAGMGKDIADEEFLQGMGEPVDDKPTPPAEPEMRDVDRALADHLCDELYYSSAITKLQWARVAEKEIADHLAAERAEHERVKAELSNKKNTVSHKHDAWQDEKKRRVYYQDIVYDVCNHLDRIFGGKTCCGTIEEPSKQVQSLMEMLTKRQFCSEDEQPYEGSPLQELTKLRTQLAATEAKLREAEGRVKALSMSRYFATHHAKRLLAELQYNPNPLASDEQD